MSKLCPLCNKDATLLTDIEGEVLVHCPSCKVTTCSACLQLDHRPLSCSMTEFFDTPEKRRILEECLSEASIRQCYYCKVPYFKIDGCERVLCSKCRRENCYSCGQASHKGSVCQGGILSIEDRKANAIMRALEKVSNGGAEDMAALQSYNKSQETKSNDLMPQGGPSEVVGPCIEVVESFLFTHQSSMNSEKIKKESALVESVSSSHSDDNTSPGEPPNEPLAQKIQNMN